MTVRRSLLAILLLSTLAACTTVDESIAPKSEEYATVVGSYDEFRRLFIRQEDQVIAIVGVNERDVTKSAVSDPHQMKVRLDPGRNRLRIEITHFRKCAKPPTTGALVSVEFDIQAKQNYRARGRENGGEFLLWLEDERTAERKSPETRIPLVYKEIPMFPSAMMGC
jgi:hypothetical protein